MRYKADFSNLALVHRLGDGAEITIGKKLNEDIACFIFAEYVKSVVNWGEPHMDQMMSPASYKDASNMPA